MFSPRAADALAANPSAIVRHYTLDHLGTPRLLTDERGAAASQHTYFPYGEEATNPFSDNGTQTSEIHRFTGHERDLLDLAGTQDDLDYMHARYYSGGVGRFLAVDVGNGRASAPQSWNRYGYALQNPLHYIDPNGKWIEVATDGNARAVKDMLVRTAMRPSGRGRLAKVASDPGFLARYKDSRMNSAGAILLALKVGTSVNVIFGQTTPIVTNGVVKGATVELDTSAIARIGRDKSGVTTTAHEQYHVSDIQAGKTSAAVGAGDLPTSATGPAEEFGQAVAAEKPDISKKEATKLVEEWLKQPLVKITSEAKPGS